MVVRIIIIVGAVNKQANGTSTSDPLHHPSSAPMDSLTVLFQYHGHTHPSLPQHLCVSGLTLPGHKGVSAYDHQLSAPRCQQGTVSCLLPPAWGMA